MAEGLSAIGSAREALIEADRRRFGSLVSETMTSIRTAISGSGRGVTGAVAKRGDVFSLGDDVTRALADLAQVTVREANRTYLLTGDDRLALRIVRFNPDAANILSVIRTERMITGGILLFCFGAVALVCTDALIKEHTGRNLLDWMFPKGK